MVGEFLLRVQALLWGQAVGTMMWHLTTLASRPFVVPRAAAQQDKTRYGIYKAQ